MLLVSFSESVLRTLENSTPTTTSRHGLASDAIRMRIILGESTYESDNTTPNASLSLNRGGFKRPIESESILADADVSGLSRGQSASLVND